MKIAIDISPLQSGHKVRGVGFYLKHLKAALEKYYPEEKYHFFTEKSDIGDAAIVHFPYFEPFFSSQPIPTRKNMLTTIHDLTPILFPSHFPPGIKGLLTWQRQRFLVKHGGGIITDSEHSKKDIVRLLRVKDSYVHVVHLAAGEEFKELAEASVRTVQKKYQLPDTFALFVGDVTWNKNLPRLLRAAALAGVPLVLVGKAITQEVIDKENPWNKDLVEVQRLIKQQDNVVALGFVESEDLVALYNAATVFVMPSLYEGFGLPILEAMQSGCPVITSHEGSLPEVAGDAALYVDAHSEDSIAQGINKIIQGKKLQGELREKGLQQAKKFSWKKTAEQTMTVYKSIVK